MTHENQSHFDANFSDMDTAPAQPMVPAVYPEAMPALPVHSMPARPNRKMIRHAEHQNQENIHRAVMTDIGIQCTAALVHSARRATERAPEGEAEYRHLVQSFVDGTGNRIRSWRG